MLTRFMEGRVRNFFTYMKTRFILQILYRKATMYLHYLRIIDKKSEQVEEKLHMSTRNQELMELLELEKSLVYFTTSLRSNEVVLEKLLKVESIKQYPGIRIFWKMLSLRINRQSRWPIYTAVS